MGSIDKWVRVLIALIITILFFTNVIEGTLGYVLIALAFIFLLTSLVSFCPLYTLFKINTCKKRK